MCLYVNLLMILSMVSENRSRGEPCKIESASLGFVRIAAKNAK